jgi:deaminated glutathione amidase
VRVAAVQMNSTEDKQRNLATAERLVRAAADDGSTLVVLPEKFNVIGTHEQLVAGAESLDGPTIGWARELARELSIDLVAGSIAERRQGREKLANTSVHIGSDGEPRAAYRKIHMFDVVVGGREYRESDSEEPGEEIVTSDAGPVSLGLTVCYDLRFPELFRILAVRGARVLTVPSAFTAVTGAAHWDTLVRARAIENQAFVVAADQIGPHPGGNESYGGSQIVDPWGDVLARAADEECFVAADLDLARQDEVRATLPSLANRVPSAYRWPGEASA